MSEKILKKAQEIILAKSEGELSLMQRRLFNLLLYRATKLGKSQTGQAGIHRTTVTEMMDYVGGQSLDRLDEALKFLSSASLILDYVDEDGSRNTSRVHYISYHMTHSQDGWVYFAFDPLLLKFIYDPKIYALMSLADIQSFKTISGAKLYEILSLRVRRKFHTEWEVGVDEFRTTMMIKDSDYQRFDNLRARIIEPAVDEINEIAPFRVTVDYIRSGRGGKVANLIFSPKLKGLSILSGHDAAMGVSNRKGSSKASEDHGDLFGYSNGESHGGITDDALEAAKIILKGNDPIHMLVEWQKAMQGRTVLRPDKSFLSWLEARVAVNEGGELEGMDMDNIDALVSNWIDESETS